MNRAGFGGTPSDIEELADLGPEKAVLRLVDFDRIPWAAAPPDWARPDPNRAETLAQLRRATPAKRRDIRRQEQQDQRQRIQDLRHWWLERMVSTPRPLEERLVLFWHGHFATSVQKVKDAWLMYRQLDTFRRHAAGNWQALLWDVTRDPAMLLWLDQAQSRKAHPNENYARELMELFTLGEGHYSESDVRAAARALTGLTLDRVRQEPVWRFRAHDDGPLRFLGVSGRFEPGDVLARIVAQPQSARFIVTKLWTYFAKPNPSQPLIEALASEFRRNGNEFRPLLRTLFLSEEFHEPTVVRSEIKSPVQWLVVALRQLERPLPQGPATLRALHELGQDLLAPPNVKGWDGGTAWINTATLTRRQELAAVLAKRFPRNPGGRSTGHASSEGGTAQQPAGVRRRTGDTPGVQALLRLFSGAERSDRALLMKAAAWRFLQAPLRFTLADDLGEVLGADRVPAPRAIREAVRVLLQSTDYQLI